MIIDSRWLIIIVNIFVYVEYVWVMHYIYIIFSFYVLNKMSIGLKEVRLPGEEHQEQAPDQRGSQGCDDPGVPGGDYAAQGAFSWDFDAFRAFWRPN